MFLSEIFEQLTYGELSSIFMGGDGELSLDTCKYPQVIAHINLGLTDLFKRFPVRLEEINVQQYDHIQIYYLDSKYAETNTESDEVYKYVKDSPEHPFKDNVLLIDKISNEDGQELYVNDTSQYWSVFTPEYNAIQVPYPEKENSMVVTYRASHPKIDHVNINPETTEVRLPVPLLEPLLLFIASRVFTNMNADNIADGNNYFTRYEDACNKVTNNGLYVTTNNANTKFENLGWT